MAKNVVVIDPAGAYASTFSAILASVGISCVCVESITAAKRSLVKGVPEVMVCPVEVEGVADAGYSFSKELQRHTVLSKMPFVLIAAHVDESSIKKAAEAGAKGMLPWPIDGATLAKHLSALLPELQNAAVARTAPAAPVAAAATARPAAAPKQAAAASNPVVDEKIRIAQQLLAKVLHNLKTSDLLQVVENEDVPRIVLEMTRSVCGGDEEEAIQKPAAQKEVAMDLDQLFGPKG